ncbi:MAG: outer membrane beta-barrel protein [Bacteroidetes bacterium]|nr:outer membrane beta-barrel protein [Bacteroidota bacterium]
MKKVVLIALILGFITLNAQDSTKTNPVTISGYAEAYYSYDLGNPGNHQRPSFFYSFNRHNEANLNIGFIKANYSESNVILISVLNYTISDCD